MKKYLFNLTAVLLAVAGSAFTTVSARLNNTWVFRGEATGEILDASKYEMSAEVHEECGAGSELPCAIELPSTVNTSNIADYFSQNFNSNQDVLDISPADRPVQ